jgi:indolepyruvate ferredoxin oxidoreductase alpha subunit
MVVVLLDDVELAGSQCRQDSRAFFDIAPGLWFEPVSAAHAYRCAREAAGLSERFDLPVVLRLTNALLRNRERIQREASPFQPRPFRRDPGRLVAHPVNARRRALEVLRRQRELVGYVEALYLPADPMPARRTILVGACAAGCQEEQGDVVWTYPLPEERLRRLLWGGVSEVVELGSPFVAEKVRALLGRPGVRGADLSATADHSAGYRVNDDFEPLFAALRSFPGCLVCGDLGAFTMDTARTVDACLCYGCSVAVAIGAARSSHPGPVFCVIGDGAWRHSGQVSAVEGQACGARVCIILLDNGRAKSTGGQVLPGTLTFPGGVGVHQAHHARMTTETYRDVLAGLTLLPGFKVLHVCC